MIELKKDVRAAQEAHEIIDSQSFRDAYARLEALYIDELLKVPPQKRHDDTRQRAQQKVEVLRAFRKQFELVIRDGKVAESKIADLDIHKTRSSLW